MQAAVWHGPKDIRVEARPIPEAIAGSVVLKVEACAICGSDLRIWREGNNRITEPRIIGHEIAGQVVAVGAGVDRFQIGDRVSVGADIPCGKCKQCLAGRANCCETNLAMGYQFDGGFANYVRLDPIVVSLGPVQRFGAALSYELAALAEPLACCINGYERALFQKGNTVVVFGGGPIGLMLALLGRRYGASQTILVEPNSLRRDPASRIAADVVIDPTTEDPVARVKELTNDLGADTVFTACPAVETHEQAIAMLAKRGVVNFFGGLPKSSRAISILSNAIHYQESYITGSHGSTPEQHKSALEMIENGSIDLRQMITHHVLLSDIGHGLEAATAGEAIKVIVQPNA